MVILFIGGLGHNNPPTQNEPKECEKSGSDFKMFASATSSKNATENTGKAMIFNPLFQSTVNPSKEKKITLNVFPTGPGGGVDFYPGNPPEKLKFTRPMDAVIPQIL